VKKMAMQKVTVGAALAATLVGVIGVAMVVGLLSASRTIPNVGNMKTVGVSVYWDRACTNGTTSINWGVLEPNTSKSFTVYVKNNGTAAEMLSLASSNWNPSAAMSYMSLSWNCTNYVLSHDSVVGAVLTLTVSPNVSGITSFDFDIIITGTEQT